MLVDLVEHETRWRIEATRATKREQAAPHPEPDVPSDYL